MSNAKLTATMSVVLSMICLSAAAQMTISATPPQTATVGERYHYEPVVTGANTATLEFSYIELPSWSKHYRGSGAIIGTPTEPGLYSNIQIQAWDGEHFAETAPFTITVQPAPPRPKGNATLSWSKPSENTNGTPLTNLAGYIVRYGTSAALLSAQIQVTSPNTTDLEIDNLSPGRWYFEVAAVSTSHSESEFSSSVSAAVD